MRVNTTKAKLAEGKVVFGGLIGGFSPELVELFGAIGYDFVFLDCEHGSMGPAEVEHMVRAAESYNITPIARIPDHADATILRYLDRGVQGIIVPHVNTREQAERIVAAARYYPEGHRGAAGGRAHAYNVEMTATQSRAWLNQQTLVIPMCEETEAVDNINDILSVPGIDVVHVAAGDLGQSMGYPPPEELRRVMVEVIGRIRAAGKGAGAGGNAATDIAGVAGMINAGANFVTIAALGLLRVGAESFRQQVEAAAGLPTGR